MKALPGIAPSTSRAIAPPCTGPGPRAAWPWRRRLGAWLLGAALSTTAAFALAQAQGADAGTIEVKPGDTFSALAGRITGNVRTWASLYDPQLSQLANPNLVLPGQRFELVTEGGKRYLRLIGGKATKLAAAATKSTAKVAADPPATAVKAPEPVPVPAAPATPAVAAVPAVPRTAAGAGEIVLGVLPNISATALMGQYESMKTYLERQTGQKVRVVLPANLKAFFESTVRGDYDLAVSAPHFARVAQLDARMVPLAMYEPRINAQFITPIEGGVTSARDLRGKAVAFANPQSLVAMYGQQWLRQQGLEPTKDYEVRAARTDMGVGRMLLSGDALAAIMSNGEFRSLPPEEASRLKIVEIFARIPNFIILGHPRLGNEQLARLKTQLLGFMADKEDGAVFSRATGINAIVEVDDAILRELDPYAAPTRRMMGTGN